MIQASNSQAHGSLGVRQNSSGYEEQNSHDGSNDSRASVADSRQSGDEAGGRSAGHVKEKPRVSRKLRGTPALQELLVSQGFHGVDAGRAAGGDVGSQ